MALARGLFGALGGSKPAKGRKGSRKAPALLALMGGLGAAGAAAFKRRQSTQKQPQAADVAPESTGGTDTARGEAA